jgi:integrase
MSLYKRVTCAKGGTCNTKGRNAKCSKCGKRPEGGAWWYRFRFAGRVIHESSRSQSLTIAREAEKQRRRQLEESWNRITRRTLPPTFDKASEEWLELQHGRVAQNTISIAKTSLKHLRTVFGSRLLCDISPEDIDTYQQKRVREKAQGKTVNIEVGILRQIMKHNDCWLPLAEKVKPLPVRKGIGRALAPDEENLLLARCTTVDSACYTATVIALNTTMRKDEIRKLRWKQIDLLNGVLTVGTSKTEAGTGRVIPLNPAATRALADWGKRFPSHEPEHYVFPWCEGKHIELSKPTKGWRTAWRTATRAVECPKCGRLQRPTDACEDERCKEDMRKIKSPLAGLRFHDLRHTAITKLAESQASDQTIMAIAGHVSRQMLEHYSHIRMAAKRSALDAIATPLPGVNSSGAASAPARRVHQNDNQKGLHQNAAVGKLLN